jgi:hypothetical protein
MWMNSSPPAMTLCLFGQITMVRRVQANLSALVVCLLALLGIMGLSAYVNGTSKLVAFKFVSTYLGFVPIFLVMLEYTPRPKGSRIVALLITVLFVQLALNVSWYLGFNPILNFDSGGPDFAHGTLGGCNYVAYFCVFIILLVMSRLLEHRRVPGLGYGLAVVLGLAAFVQLLFTFTFHALLLLAMCGGLNSCVGRSPEVPDLAAADGPQPAGPDRVDHRLPGGGDSWRRRGHLRFL